MNEQRKVIEKVFATWDEFDQYCKLLDKDEIGYSTFVNTAKRQWKIEYLTPNVESKCKVSGCTTRAVLWGYCQFHYNHS
jgi:hypothetical protein